MNKPTKFLRNGMPTAALDLQEASAYLAVSPWTLRRLVGRGDLPHARVLNSLRFRVEDLDEYLRAQTRRTWEPEAGRGRPRSGHARGAPRRKS